MSVRRARDAWIMAGEDAGIAERGLWAAGAGESMSSGGPRDPRVEHDPGDREQLEIGIDTEDRVPSEVGTADHHLARFDEHPAREHVWRVVIVRSRAPPDALERARGDTHRIDAQCAAGGHHDGERLG